MTQPSDLTLVAEAAAVTAAKAVVALCLVMMGCIIAAGFWKGRRMESVWPDEEAPEPQQADVRSSIGIGQAGPGHAAGYPIGGRPRLQPSRWFPD